MKITLLAFATAAERLGWRTLEIDGASIDTPRTLFLRAAPGFVPESARVAVDCEYRDWDEPIGESAREVAVIPPVSGG